MDMREASSSSKDGDKFGGQAVDNGVCGLSGALAIAFGIDVGHGTLGGVEALHAFVGLHEP